MEATQGNQPITDEMYQYAANLFYGGQTTLQIKNALL